MVVGSTGVDMVVGSTGVGMVVGSTGGPYVHVTVPGVLCSCMLYVVSAGAKEAAKIKSKGGAPLLLGSHHQ